MCLTYVVMYIRATLSLSFNALTVTYSEIEFASLLSVMSLGFIN